MIVPVGFVPLVSDAVSVTETPIAPPADAVRRDVPRSSKDYQVFYVNTTDVAALHAEYKGRGVAVSELRVTVYGMKEFEVRDPDDYWLWFGQPTDEPPTVKE